MRRRRGTLSLAAARMPAPGDQAVLDDQTLAELTRRFYEKADLDPILGPVILAVTYTLLSVWVSDEGSCEKQELPESGIEERAPVESKN